MIRVIHTNSNVSLPISEREYETIEDTCRQICVSSHEPIDEIRESMKTGEFVFGTNVWKVTR